MGGKLAPVHAPDQWLCFFRVKGSWFAQFWRPEILDANGEDLNTQPCWGQYSDAAHGRALYVLEYAI